MDQDISNRLDRIEKIVSDNNRMLAKMRKAQKNAAYMRVIYWLIFIVIAIASWYFIQPYLASLGNTYSSITGGASTVSNLVNQYDGSQKTTQ